MPRPVMIVSISMFAFWLCQCGSESPSTTSSIYGRLNWGDPQAIASEYDDPKIRAGIEETAAATVVLSDKQHSFVENGTCTGLIGNYRGYQWLFTAGHCIRNQNDCDKLFMSPNFEYRDWRYVSKTHLLKCEKLLIYEETTDQEVDFAIATFSEFKRHSSLGAIKGYPIRRRQMIGALSLIGSGHPNSLDEETVKEINDRPENNLNDLEYLGTRYTQSKKTSHRCSSFVTTDRYFTYDCDTRKGYSGAVFFTLPEFDFAGIHFGQGKIYSAYSDIDARLLNRGTLGTYVLDQLDAYIETNPDKFPVNENF